MKLINQLSLARGRVLIDYAYLGDALAATMGPADYVGLVAAYIVLGQPTHEMQEQLTRVLGPRIAAATARTYETFQDEEGRGLWAQGPATDDIGFTHRKLNAQYPVVKERLRKLGVDSDRPF